MVLYNIGDMTCGTVTRHWKLALGSCVFVCSVVAGGIFLKKAIERHKLVQNASSCRTRAEKGDAKAEFDLGSLYYVGVGVPQDYAEAARWYRKAADQGDANAKAGLASMYYYGKGVPQDYSQAVRWYRNAAEQNNTVGEFGLASMYYEAKGVPQDYSEAARWYRKAADKGNALAQLNLGFMCRQGEGVPQDYGEAVSWYRKAAYQGNAEAEYSLGYMYYNGQGLPQDYPNALRWYRKAAYQGSPEARRALDSIERESSIAAGIRYAVLVIAFLGGGVLSLSFFWPGRTLRDTRHTTALGLIALSYGGLSLYGLTHDNMRYSECRNLFYLGQGTLIGMAVIVGIMVMVAKPSKASQ